VPLSWTRFGIGRTAGRRPSDSLTEMYAEALEELRSWNDPAVAGLIATLESRYREATTERRYGALQRRASRAIRWSL
jgi:hypothetical protein